VLGEPPLGGVAVKSTAVFGQKSSTKAKSLVNEPCSVPSRGGAPLLIPTPTPVCIDAFPAASNDCA
jgi:hypothetical protein